MHCTSWNCNATYDLALIGVICSQRSKVGTGSYFNKTYMYDSKCKDRSPD